MAKRTNITLRADPDWLRTIGRLLNVLGRGHGDIDRSSLLRHSLTKEAIFFLDAPYVCTRAQHFILILGNGDIHHRRVETLELRDATELLRFNVRMIPEMRTKLLYKSGADSIEESIRAIREHWLLNYFGAWRGNQIGGVPLGESTDLHGLAEKSAALTIRQPQDTLITRESIAVWKDHVQYVESAGDLSDDRIATVIGVPTLDLNIYVAVDRELYSANPSTFRSAAVGIQYRNSESARISRRVLGSEAKKSSWYEDRFPKQIAKHVDKEYISTSKEVLLKFREYKNRLANICSGERIGQEGNRIVSPSVDRNRLDGIELPESYLFGHFRWPMPYLGVEVSVTWNKPERASHKTQEFLIADNSVSQ